MGGALWLMSVIVLSKAWSPWMALGAATAVHVAVGSVLLDRVRVLRTQVRTLSMVLITGYPHPRTEATHTEMKKIAAVSCTADFMHAEGRISATEHESVWWQAYQRLDLAIHGSACRYDGGRPVVVTPAVDDRVCCCRPRPSMPISIVSPPTR